MTGIYIHIPFCKRKCPYCDFYSFKADESKKDSYLKAVLLCLDKWKEKISDDIDTVYFGGGTPSVFGGERIAQVISFIKESFVLTEDAEITVECNPSSVSEKFFLEIRNAGVNRISMGMQSAVDKERLTLGRLSDCNQVRQAVAAAKEAGIDNISLDIMLGVPYQTMESLDESIDFLLSFDIPHISAYMLKIEEGTPFDKMEDILVLPDEDAVSEMYLHTSRCLSSAGYNHYEVSNFAKDGKESRHNTRYWLGQDYIGIGPSAHSYLHGERFYYDRDFNGFIEGNEPVFDGFGGDKDEYVMLRLRLAEGLDFKEYEKKYNEKIDEEVIEKMKKYQKAGLLHIDDKGVRLTPEGFLLSNAIIGEFIR
ncbi:MAG: radical SAM family heme chaperone HemW [Clostridia bacterium]|nr:radical SAM family heme chaperone HemW [Clostridia bacterium]